MKKGFTLIELLAVIVILAIISIIAIPLLLNVIDKAKQGTAESSALGYIDAVEKQVMINKVKSGNEIAPGEYTKSELTAKGLTIKGEVEDAVVVINAKGKVTQARFCIDGLSIEYDGKNSKVNNETNYCEDMESILNALPVGTEYTFDYTGSEQTFTAPKSGTYKLEVWGAQGGAAKDAIGGYGGYSVGIAQLNKNALLYINVGGEGATVHHPVTSIAGGYNGGGSANFTDSRSSVQNALWLGSGGGATHIALVSGELASLESYKGELVDNKYYVSDTILIVGAGGGGGDHYTYSSAHNGTSAGGYVGVGSSGSGGTITTGGTQTTGGTLNWADSHAIFGKGCEYTINNWISGGGSGFFGGGCGYGSGTAGGGGSSYIASSKLISNSTTTKHMACYNCSGNSLSSDSETNTIAALGVDSAAISDYAKSGNGYAKITYLGK